jgi:hypothetical protein
MVAMSAPIKAGIHSLFGVRYLPNTEQVDTIDCPDLDSVVRAGFNWARPDGIVLLSLAAPSFGHFRDYRDRAEAFSLKAQGFAMHRSSLSRHHLAYCGSPSGAAVLAFWTTTSRSRQPAAGQMC